MKFSYNWIRELVDGLTIEPAELGRLITLKTAECEGVEEYAPFLARTCAARVLEVEEIPNSRNRKALVDAGPVHGRKTVVCGAANCRAGLLTAYVPVGVTVAGGKEVREAKIAGVESGGMLASGDELGLNRDHEGILELDGLHPGDPLPFTPDTVIEIDNKSLTHRPDLWGHYGMAREVAAITGLKLKDPVNMALLPPAPGPVQVAIEDLALCPRYSALVFDNVAVGPSPLWLQYKLEAIGLNPINNIVDITNLILAEIAQPMHAFDADKLHGDTIFIRPARAGERCLALNGETYDLTAANLVIADAAGPVAIAGVIGGGESAINESTRRIVFESANFLASSIRKTSSALKLRTDASMRFEKSQDPLNTVRGLARAVELMALVCPGSRLVGGLSDQAAVWKGVAPIHLPLDWLDRKLGRHVEKAEVRQILESLQFGVDEPSPGHFRVSVPSWRATKDIAIKDDLVEEVGRMIGYSSITPAPPLQPVTVPPGNEERDYHHAVRRMAAAQGFTEVYNYSFLSEENARQFSFPPERHIAVSNPIAADQSLLRISLVPGIWRNVSDNGRYFDHFALFEIGREIHPRAEGLPDEKTVLAAACYTRQNSGAAHLWELKRLAESIAPGASVTPCEARPFEHPARAGEILLNGSAIGRLFEFHPAFVEQGRAGVLELYLEPLHQLLAARERRYRPVRRFPASQFDLSVLVSRRTLATQVESLLREHAVEACEEIAFVTQYEGSPLPEGKKSISYRVTVAAPDRTLSSEEIAQYRARMVEGLRAAGFDLR